MHEWALAQAVVRAALKEGAKSGIIVSLGELQQIDRDTFRFALDEIAKSEGFTARIAIRTEPAQMKCRSCGHSWKLTDSRLSEDQSEYIHFVPDVVHVYVRCPSCGSPDFEITSGRGVTFEVEG